MTIVDTVEFISKSGPLGVLVILVYWMMNSQKDISNNSKIQIESIATAMTSHANNTTTQIRVIMDAHNVQVLEMNRRHEQQVEILHNTYEKKLEILTASYERQMVSIATSYSKSMDQMMALLKDSQNSNQELSKQSVSAITKQGSNKKNE